MEMVQKEDGKLGHPARSQHVQGWTLQMFGMGVMIAMSTSYQLGYNISVLNQPSVYIKEYYRQVYSSPAFPNQDTFFDEISNQTDYNNTQHRIYMSNQHLTILWSFSTTIWVVGGMVGAFSTGFLADKVGRKKALFLMTIPGFIGSLSCYISPLVAKPSLLIIGRFITGINCGLGAQLGPLYMLEIVPYNIKGAMGSLHQLAITLGILTSSIFGLSSLLGTATLWPYTLLLNCVPNLACIVAFAFLPESPRYSMIVLKKKDQAEKALRWLFKTNDVSVEISEMISESKENNDDDKYTMMRMLKDKSLLAPLMITVGLQLAQQLSGINAMFYYSSSIYVNAGIPDDKIEYANLGTCAINFLVTILVVPLMDKAGRRPLLLLPIAGMILTLAVITAALKLQYEYTWLNYVSVACIITYVVMFNFGPGPIPCIMTAELFRQGPRGPASSIAGLTVWLANAAVALTFEILQEHLKKYVFMVFLGINVFSWVFVFFKVPETKNKTFNQIAAQFTKPQNIA